MDNIPHVIIATPGRLYDMTKTNLTFKKYICNLKILVLDEFDKLFDKSLLFFIEKIYKLLP